MLTRDDDTIHFETPVMGEKRSDEIYFPNDDAPIIIEMQITQNSNSDEIDLSGSFVPSSYINKQQKPLETAGSVSMGSANATGPAGFVSSLCNAQALSGTTSTVHATAQTTILPNGTIEITSQCQSVILALLG